jgi:hypothetical protein
VGTHVDCSSNWLTFKRNRIRVVIRRQLTLRQWCTKKRVIITIPRRRLDNKKKVEFARLINDKEQPLDFLHAEVFIGHGFDYALDQCLEEDG